MFQSAEIQIVLLGFKLLKSWFKSLELFGEIKGCFYLLTSPEFLALGFLDELVIYSLNLSQILIKILNKHQMRIDDPIASFNLPIQFWNLFIDINRRGFNFNSILLHGGKFCLDHFIFLRLFLIFYILQIDFLFDFILLFYLPFSLFFFVL